MTSKLPRRLVWAVEMLDVKPDDRILEIGCGHGVAVALICEKLSSGTITAIDRSAKAIETARARNGRCVASGRASFHTVALADASFAGEAFNKIFAVNVNVFWLKPARELIALKHLLAPDGALYLFYETPAPGKTAEVAEKARFNLEKGGFVVDETQFGEAGACIIARRAGS